MSDSTKVFSTRQEKMVAKQLGGYPVGGSGAMPGVPGDVKTYDWLVECKTHTEPGHNILFNAKVWKKIKEEAMVMHRKPVLIVDDGSQSASNTWCLCNRHHINFDHVFTSDWPVAIRTNLTGTDDKLKEALRRASKHHSSDFYTDDAFDVQWGEDRVAVMPLKLFKELFEK